MSSIEVKGLEEALNKLDRATGDAVIKRILTGGSSQIHKVVQVYPPSSEANTPKTSWKSGGPNYWYQRGFGSKWIRKDGTINFNDSSEQITQRWTTEVGKYRAVLGSNVSYGRYVMDEAKQAKIHGERGWRTIQDIAEKERDEVLAFAKREIDKELAKG
jgi:hypothetical protein